MVERIPSPTRTWAQRWRRFEPLRRRVVLGAAAGSVGSVGLALLDGRWAHRSQDVVAMGRVAIAAVGAIAPVALALGTAVGCASALVHPVVAPSLGRFVERLRRTGTGRPADFAAFVPLAILGLFAWTTITAHVGRAFFLGDGPPRMVGIAAAVTALALLAVVAEAVFALTPTLRRVLAIAGARSSRFVDPAAMLLGALAVVAALIAYGAWQGSVSGEGGLLGIYGILKRPELDLRMPGAWLAFVAFVYLAAAPLARVPTTLALVLSLAPLAITAHQARSLEANPEVARVLERYAPAARIPLALLRRAGDRDRDGASRWFGGGDCNDRDRGIGPAAEDIPDNGVDEDCSGSDLSLAGMAREVESAATPIARERLPKSGNLVLITIDTLRADLGFNGYPRPVSPNLDALANRGTVFERAYSLASYTGKSVGPMLIGKFGSETHRNWGHFNQFSSEDTFVAERLRSAGLRTVSVHGHRYFGAFGGLDRGFDAVDLSAAPPEGANWATDQTSTSSRLSDATIARLKAMAATDRFFLWVHYLDPHADYLRHDDVPTFGSSARDQYDHEVAHTDRHIGRVLDFIASQPWADRTTIVVTSDHGEAFGEHGMTRHGFELWEPLVRVPLIVHVPGVPPSRVTDRRSLIDLVPTILDVLDVPSPPRRDAAPAGSWDFVSGLSLVPDVLRGPGAPAVPRDIVIDMPAGPFNEARRAYIHGDLKLVVSRDSVKELFDLGTDPGEEHNLWKSRREEIEAPYAVTKGRMRILDVKAP